MNETMGDGIELARKRMKVLLDAVSIARWVVSAVDASADDAYRGQVEELEQSVLQLAAGLGMEDQVWPCPGETSLLHASFEDEQGDAWHAVERYNEESFWLEFVRRMSLVLAKREIAQAGGHGAATEERVAHHEAHLGEVLEHHGLDALMVLPPLPAG